MAKIWQHKRKTKKRVRMSTALMVKELAKYLKFMEEDQNVVWNEKALDYVAREA